MNENLIITLALKILKARAVFILNQNGTWNNYGIPIPEFKTETFIEEHDAIPDNRKGAWWIK